MKFLAPAEQLCLRSLLIKLWTISYPENSRPIIFRRHFNNVPALTFFIGLFEEHAASDIIMENTKPKALEVEEPTRTRRSARLDQKRNPGRFGSSSRSPTKDSFKRRKSGAGINESLYGVGVETSDREESEAEEVEEPEEHKVPTSKKILQ